MKELKDVTLYAVDCTDRIKGTIQALLFSMLKINFGKVKLLSHERPNCLPPEIEFEKIDKITNINEYNSFMFFYLPFHVNTRYSLLIQDHAYIINPELWDDKWLQYDYIGAPWQNIPNAYLTDSGERVEVGNGGFSFRSYKLMDAPFRLGLKLEQRQGFFNEDGNLNIYHRDILLDYGIKYAPVEVAAKFSYENPVPENNMGKTNTFGFHRNYPLGIHNE